MKLKFIQRRKKFFLKKVTKKEKTCYECAK